MVVWGICIVYWKNKKKLVRNKKFIVVVSIMLLVEIMTIIYCLGEKKMRNMWIIEIVCKKNT